MSSSQSSSSTASSASSSSAANNTTNLTNTHQKEAWPSLSLSPISVKDSVATGTGQLNTNGKNKKDKCRNDKTRNDKSKAKNKSQNSNTSNTSNKENFLPDRQKRDRNMSSTVSEINTDINNSTNQQKADQNKDKSSTPGSSTEQQLMLNAKRVEQYADQTVRHSSKCNNETNSHKKNNISESNATRSLSRSSSDKSVDRASVSSVSTSDDYEKCQPNVMTSGCHTTNPSENIKLEQNDSSQTEDMNIIRKNCFSATKNFENICITEDQSQCVTKLPVDDKTKEISDVVSKLNLLDDTNSYFSSTPTFHQSFIFNKKLESEQRQLQINSAISSRLPDLLNGIDGYQKASNTNEWEEAYKNVMTRNNRHVEEQLIHQQQLQQQQQQHHQQVLQQQEEFIRMHELQKRNNLINNLPLSQRSDSPADMVANFNENNVGRAHTHALLQQQQQILNQHLQAGESGLTQGLYGGNMTKFFDFHKGQQQLHHQYLSGHTTLHNTSNVTVTEPHRHATFLENSRPNSSFSDNNLFQVQKQRVGLFEPMSQTQFQRSQSQVNRLPQNSTVDDDLGFDPFIETQKGLAELMENEVVQQQNLSVGNFNLTSQHQHISHQQLIDNVHRARMPPPGFNHMNANVIGFNGSPKAHTSKVMSFVNMPATVVGNNGTPAGQVQIPLLSNWNTNLTQMHQNPVQTMSENQLQNQGTHSKGFNNNSNDWTAMDPAILSLRQFSSFPQSGQTYPQNQQDMFLQHLAQQQQPNSQGFNNQPQQLVSGITMLNGQQASPQVVNANVQGMLEFLKNRQFV
ncbi:putative uncharacterized protein DDB_G0285119 [Drosophila tropicalis]|uniref:putative uncharacterized protein DDB_G0285119 n=1 Tax=Drosophila tropicalis TaxID=46794 RepID=UPI0035ABFAB8